MKKIKAVDENILFLFLVIILSGTILTNPCTTFAWCLKKSCVVGEDRSGGSSSGSSREYYNYTTPPTYDPQAQNRQQAFNINQQGVMYYNNKDCANALQSFKQALQYWPDNATIQKNLQNAQSCLDQQNWERETQQKEAQSAEKMRQNLDQLSSQLTADKSGGGGIDFDGRQSSSVKSSGKLDFMPAAPSGKISGAPTSVSKTSSQPVVDSSVVDLRFLDADKPITVDPNVVKGKQRVFPAQPSLETLNNPNYNKGFDAIRNGDPFAAVEYFKKALKERPGDPLVGNALLLAEDLVKVRQQKAQNQAYKQALETASQGIDALFYNNDTAKALSYMKQAHAINPADQGIRDTMNYLEGLHAGTQKAQFVTKSLEEKNKEKIAMRVAAHSIIAINRGDYKGAIKYLKLAQTVCPDDQGIQNTLSFVEGLEIGRNEGRKDKNKR